MLFVIPVVLMLACVCIVGWFRERRQRKELNNQCQELTRQHEELKKNYAKLLDERLQGLFKQLSQEFMDERFLELVKKLEQGLESLASSMEDFRCLPYIFRHPSEEMHRHHEAVRAEVKRRRDSLLNLAEIAHLSGFNVQSDWGNILQRSEEMLVKSDRAKAA